MIAERVWSTASNNRDIPWGEGGDCCSYNAVRIMCQKDSLGVLRITSIYWGGMGLDGSLDDGIGDLTGLKGLSLSSNRLTGTIPESIGQLTGLEVLYLYSNQLSGPIPNSINDLKSLTEFVLDDDTGLCLNPNTKLPYSSSCVVEGQTRVCKFPVCNGIESGVTPSRSTLDGHVLTIQQEV